MQNAHTDRKFLFDHIMLQPIGRLIHRFVRQKPRGQNLATMFYRNLLQLQVFDGPLRGMMTDKKIRILVAGCSLGCEAYTLAGYLVSRFPNLDWSICAVDIDAYAVEFAKEAVYGESQGVGNETSELALVIKNNLFINSGEQSRIKPEIIDRLSIKQMDVLSSEFQELKNFDVVFGQNFLVHMTDEFASRAFEALVGALRPSGVFFVRGVDLGLRASLVKRHNLAPVDWAIEEIHNEDVLRRSAWPWYYWGLEALQKGRSDYLNRYCTIFVKPGNG